MRRRLLWTFFWCSPPIHNVQIYQEIPRAAKSELKNITSKIHRSATQDKELQAPWGKCCWWLGLPSSQTPSVKHSSNIPVTHTSHSFTPQLNMALFCAVSCCAHFQWPSGCDRNAFVDSRYVQVFTTFTILFIIGHHSWHAAVAGQLRPMHACVHTCNCAPVHDSYRSRTGHYFTLLAAPSRRRQAKCSQGQSCCGTCDKSCGSPRGLGKNQGIFASSDTKWQCQANL